MNEQKHLPASVGYGFLAFAVVAAAGGAYGVYQIKNANAENLDAVVDQYMADEALYYQTGLGQSDQVEVVVDDNADVTLTNDAEVVTDSESTPVTDEATEPATEEAAE